MQLCVSFRVTSKKNKKYKTNIANMLLEPQKMDSNIHFQP